MNNRFARFLPTAKQLVDNSQHEVLEAIRGNIRQAERMARRVSPRSSMVNNVSANLIFGEGDAFDESGTDPFTGTAIVYPAYENDSGSWHIFGKSAGILQAGWSSTTGKILAGAGVVTLDADGVTVSPSSDVADDINAYKFADSVGTVYGGVYNYLPEALPGSENSVVELKSNYDSTEGKLQLIAIASGETYFGITSNYVLYNNERAGIWNIALKTANETIQSDVTVSNDAELIFDMEASAMYCIRGKIFFDTTALADFRYRFNGPSTTPTLLRAVISHIVPGTATKVDSVETTSPTTQNIVTGGGTTMGYVEIDAIYHNDSTANTFRFQWAQGTSTAANTTVLAGSYLEYMKIL